ncbi:hypothetical protein M758_8G079900 [Ceratodon purpureus]|nr:hypothetical protein M758_8G079900 [Ceratodon purpureus]
MLSWLLLHLPALGSRIQHTENSLSTLCTLRLSGKLTLMINNDDVIRYCFYNNGDDRTSSTALMWSKKKAQKPEFFTRRFEELQGLGKQIRNNLFYLSSLSYHAVQEPRPYPPS